MKEIMLTTIDNPYDPFTQFDEWLSFDTAKGYNSCGYLARVAVVSDALSDADYDQEVERAIDQIVKYDPLCVFKKAQRNVEAQTV